MHPPSRQSRSAAARAFTLVEMIVVVIIVALLFSMTIPRFAGSERRTLQTSADQVADLLLMYAQRASLDHRPVGVWYDEDRRAIMLMIVDIDEQRPDAPPDWRLDRLVAPVRLPATVDLLDARADGEPVDLAIWPISNRPGQQRPTIEITLGAFEHETTVMLAAHAIAPRRIDWDDDVPAERIPIDLDAEGRTREEW
ncbi:MAG: prepilin-type N-terminal cleavage/methylation domain-containing protein [Planctomycetota bacterium]